MSIKYLNDTCPPSLPPYPTLPPSLSTCAKPLVSEEGVEESERCQACICVWFSPARAGVPRREGGREGETGEKNHKNQRFSIPAVPSLPPSLPPYLGRVPHHLLPCLSVGRRQKVRRGQRLFPSLSPALPPSLPHRRKRARHRGRSDLLILLHLSLCYDPPSLPPSPSSTTTT